mgnify:CR=1 FL=1
MTDHRELLELAARAVGIDVKVMEDGSNARRNQLNLGGSAWWNPREDSGDCADMCAALGIDTKWGASIVACGSDRVLRWLAEPCAKLEYRPAAWRLAALRVAAEIGKGMRG